MTTTEIITALEKSINDIDVQIGMMSAEGRELESDRHAYRTYTKADLLEVCKVRHLPIAKGAKKQELLNALFADIDAEVADLESRARQLNNDRDALCRELEATQMEKVEPEVKTMTSADIKYELNTTRVVLEASSIKELREIAARHQLDLSGRNRSKAMIIEVILENMRKGLEQEAAQVVEEPPIEKVAPIIEETSVQPFQELQTTEGYKGFRIHEDEYNHLYGDGLYVPQHRVNGRWRAYKSRTGEVSYKTARGAYNFLVKQEQLTGE